MQIIMKRGASKKDVDRIIEEIKRYNGLRPYLIEGEELSVIPIVGTFEGYDKEAIKEHFLSFLSIEDVIIIASPYKLVSKECGKRGQTKINGYQFGDKKIYIIAGPCSIESKDQIISVSLAVKNAGATFLRGGAFKPRTSPYGFLGLGEDGLKLLFEAKKISGLPTITEVMRPAHIELAMKYEVDILQIGARNSQDFELLSEAGKSGKVILIKNGLAGSVQDLLLSAEYVAKERTSANDIILCLRGIRTFETETRNTLDVTLIPILKEKTFLPIFVDPSHAPGKWKFVESLAMAAIAAGADGLLIEVHPEPENAKSDGPQQLTIENFVALMENLKNIAHAVKREI